MHTFQYNIGTHPPVVLQSRNAREGRYAGKYRGRDCRIPEGLREFHLVLPFGVFSNGAKDRAYKRRGRKADKLWWKQAI